MKIFNKLLCVSVFVCISFISNAKAAPNQATGWVEITKIADHTYFDEGMIIYTSGTSINPAGCPGSGYYALLNANATYKTKSAMAMGAFLGKKEVNFTIDGTGCDYSNNYPRILNISIR